jgi:hypothetical protein
MAAGGSAITSEIFPVGAALHQLAFTRISGFSDQQDAGLAVGGAPCVRRQPQGLQHRHIRVSDLRSGCAAISLCALRPHLLVAVGQTYQTIRLEGSSARGAVQANYDGCLADVTSECGF